MHSRHRSAWQQMMLPAALAVAAIVGCGGAQDATTQVNKAAKEAGVPVDAVFPLAGKVLIDGAPSSGGKGTVIIMLNEEGKDDVPTISRPFADVQNDGSFKFATYAVGDGARAGHYVVTIAKLRRRGKKGYLGPDQLNNLYNDPAVNAKKPEFVIDHKEPGKQDYVFDLKVVGVEPVKEPGQKALKEMVDEP